MNKQELKDKIFDKAWEENQWEYLIKLEDLSEILDDYETLSQEWIDENAIVIGGLHSNPQYIHVDKLQNLLVPSKRDQLEEAYEDIMSRKEFWFDGKHYKVVEVSKEETVVPKQEKPVVPKFVGEYIDHHKNITNLSEIMCAAQIEAEEYSTGERKNMDTIFGWIIINQNLFARAWLDGYTTEQEPKFYAVVKGGDLLSDEKYWNYWIENESLEIGDNKVHSDVIAEYMLKATKDEWNKLGINDTNADFEEVDTNG